MVKLPDNIIRQHDSYRNCSTYIGYTPSGFGRRILKAKGLWYTFPLPDEGRDAPYLEAPTLIELSVKLKELVK